jgi:peptidoglycan/xylan/chitin deacetylase (PgdA/CDA1 family)
VIARRSWRGTIITLVARRPPVLMYHGVECVSDDSLGLFLTPDRFAGQMQTLRRLGLKGVSLSQLEDRVKCRQAGALVGLTFDDAYRGVFRFAVPILEQHKFTATIFAVTGLIGRDNLWDPPPRRALMTEAELRSIAERGFDVGSHGVSHIGLAGLDADILRREVEDSRTVLTSLTGKQTRSFCYPYGSVDAPAVSAVAAAGYSHACAVWRVRDVPMHLARPRVGVVERDAGLRFVAKLFLRGR